MTIYSHSRISTFESCKLKFKYKYIDNLEPEIKATVETFLGSRVHDVLEQLYKDLKHQKKTTKEELIANFEKTWNELWDDEVLIVRKDYTQENYLDMGRKFLSDYYNHYAPFNQATTIGVETRIVIKLDKEGKYVLQGYIDRLDSKGEVYEIHDYKTANNLPLQEYVDKDRQLALYAIAIKEQYKDAKDVKLIWHYLAFDKEITSERTDAQLQTLRKEIIGLIQEIEACREFPSTTSALCDWCEYRPICPQWKHLYQTEEKKYAKPDDGVKLVDEYSKLKEEEASIKKQLDNLRDRIIAFAEREGAETVFGTKQRAKLWSKECDKFPKTTELSYQDFVETVKKLGLWNEFSKLDVFKLEKAYESNEFHGEIQEILRKFVSKEKVERIYLGKK
ncbi:MAG: PD-(D/E)XK nuclease family protein [archaeon]